MNAHPALDTLLRKWAYSKEEGLNSYLELSGKQFYKFRKLFVSVNTTTIISIKHRFDDSVSFHHLRLTSFSVLPSAVPMHLRLWSYGCITFPKGWCPFKFLLFHVLTPLWSLVWLVYFYSTVTWLFNFLIIPLSFSFQLESWS